MIAAHDHPQALPPGFLLAEYRIERVLGSGGFGITYLAEDTVLHKKLAIKEYLPVDFALRLVVPNVAARSRGVEDDFRWGLERFLDEARTLARFRHPNLVPVLRFFEAHGTAYMVMEYEQGDTLAQVVGELEQAYDESSARALLLPLLDGLAAVHAAGFLHRDVKPANIVLRPGGVPVLIDFGAARQALGGRSRSMTNIVTPRYAPIEQYGIDPNQGPWSDIYGLAAVMHTALTGEPPPDAVSRVPEDKYRRLAERRLPGFRPGFLAAIDWGLEVFAKDRPQSIAEWRQALDGAIASPLPPAALTRRVETTIPAAVAPLAPEAPAMERPAPVTSTAAPGPVPRWILPVAVLAVAAIGGAIFLSQRPQPAGRAAPAVSEAPTETAAAPPAASPPTAPAQPAPQASQPTANRAAAARPDTARPAAKPPAKTESDQSDPNRITIAEAQGLEAAKAARAKAEEAELTSANARVAAGDATALAEQARLRAAEAASVTSLALAAVDLPDGGRYAGELNAGAKEGLGVLIAPDGRRYAGQWRQDWPEGRGALTYADGRRYEGELQAGKRHGLGVLVLRDGTRLEGEWREDRAQGLGTIVHADGRKLQGQWRETGLEGLGVAVLAGGQRYEGEWREGRRNGYGALTSGEGKVEAGQWRDDAPAGSQ
ncbi:MAG: protein kinase [Reyranellaceae bacterium]